MSKSIYVHLDPISFWIKIFFRLLSMITVVNDVQMRISYFRIRTIRIVFIDLIITFTSKKFKTISHESMARIETKIQVMTHSSLCNAIFTHRVHNNWQMSCVRYTTNSVMNYNQSGNTKLMFGIQLVLSPWLELPNYYTSHKCYPISLSAKVVCIGACSCILTSNNNYWGECMLLFNIFHIPYSIFRYIQL